MSIDAAHEMTGVRLDRPSQAPQSTEADKESRQWTLKGLAPETVEVTREAARRSGMKLNYFVSLALEKAAADVASGNTVERASDSDMASDDLQAIKAELAKIRAQGEQLESTINSISAILLKICADRL